MPDKPIQSPRRAPAVLAMSRSGAEWFDRDARGRVFHGVCETKGVRPADLVAAAVQARRESGGRGRACVLAIDFSLARHKLLSVPPLPRKELGRVFLRKATQLMDGAEGEVLFTSLPMGKAEVEGAQQGMQNWLLVAQDGEYMRELSLRLRSSGFKVRRVVARSLAVLCRARMEVEGDDEPFIAVSVDHGVATVSLAHGDQIVYRDRIEGDLLSDPALPTSVIQLVRSCAAYWRKHRRGQQVKRVVLLGLPAAQGELLSHAIAAAVGGGEVVILPRDSEGPEAGRHSFLEATTSTGVICPDLSLPLPAHGPLAVLLIAAFLLATGTLAWIVHGTASDELRDVRLDTATLNSRVAELVGYEQRNENIEGDVRLLGDYLRRTVDIGTHGIDLDAVLSTAVHAFDGRASLSDIEVDSALTGERTLILRGSANPSPTRVLSDLRALEEELEADPALTEVVLSLPDRLSDGGGDSRPHFAFTVEATLDRRRGAAVHRRPFPRTASAADERPLEAKR